MSTAEEDAGAWRISRARLDEQYCAEIRRRKPRYLPFARARVWARAQWQSTEEEWKEWIANGEKKNAYVPSEPDVVYEDDWTRWDDFLNEPNT